ncbi:MAG: helix-turn-helix transcriptional regulator [Planctomycetes bacterium]|nr:helix-turn-helix transcriptional regulator [Planctomycetota bacterium]
MPTTQAKARAAKGIRGRSVKRARNPAAREFIKRGNRITHVLLPINEYERYEQMQEAARLTKKLEDPNAKWIGFEDFSAMLAADAVVEARKKAGLTQGQLAAKLKMPQSQISRIERNPDRTTVRTLKKIAKALGVDVAKLL